MKHLLTEQVIRQLLKKDGSLKSLSVPAGSIVTPLAQDFLKAKGISLDFTQEEKLNTKPEELTHLYGNQLTKKDNPVIIFRGKLDSLCAMILEAQLLGEENKNPAFVNDMQEVLDFTRSIMPAEYRGEPMGDLRVLGYSSDELREISHNTEKHYGRSYLLMKPSMGPLCLRLNLLRTAAREAELAAVTAFEKREDIVKALNRLSSLFYILIFKYLPSDHE